MRFFAVFVGWIVLFFVIQAPETFEALRAQFEAGNRNFGGFWSNAS